MRKMLASLIALVLSWAGTAHAQSYPDTLDLYRADGMLIRLIWKVDAPRAGKFYLYSEPGYTQYCSGLAGSGSTTSSKAQSMDYMAITLGKGTAYNINETDRSHIMWDNDSNAYVVQLPTVAERTNLRNKYGGKPSSWSGYCGFNGPPIAEGSPEFLTSTPNWRDHSAYNMDDGTTHYRWNSDLRAVALRVIKVGPSQVCLFEHGKYEGEALCFGAGDYSWFGDFNDKVSSIAVGKKCSVRLYEHGDYNGKSKIYTSNSRPDGSRYANVAWWVDDMNDKTSSMKVRCNEDTVFNDSEVCLFEHGDLTGNSICYGHGAVRHTDRYLDTNRAEDTFSSMVVGKNCSVTLYEHADYNGTSASYSAKTTGKNLNVNWLGAFNDKTSSLKVNCN